MLTGYSGQVKLLPSVNYETADLLSLLPMKSLQEFTDSLKNGSPDHRLSVQLKALWYDGKGEWNKAHNEVDHLSDQPSAHIHAYLHRKEGDIWNADYWYKRAQQTRPDISLDEEWAMLVTLFL